MAVQQFRLPDLGEGLTEGDLLKWTVAVGETIEVNATIAEVETVKAAVELPSPYAGVVIALHAAEGETVPVGTPIISIETSPAIGGQADSRPVAAAEGAGGRPGVGEDMIPRLPSADEPQQTLVGYGPRESSGGRRRRRSPSAPGARAVAEPAVAEPAVRPLVEPAVRAVAEPAVRQLAKPPVRQLAKSLGVDLAGVAATGPNGTISRDDVQAAATSSSLGAAQGLRAVSPAEDRETRVPVKGVRKHTAAAMVSSAFTAPHVTEFLTLDVTATMDLRDRVAARREFREVKVSPLLFVAKAVLLAASRTPTINATWDEPAGEIVLAHYVNLGIAAATERGLIVPNIKDADRLSLLELAHAMAELTETARAGRTTPADLTGGTFTITNVGVFGVDTGTPILNPGESGILAFGAVRRQPWVVGAGPDERIEPRWVTTLGLSFDHRVVDGEQGSRFLADVGAVLADPGMALL